MLSKKMAFSLMSLITIFALAFAVPSAMADNNIGSELIMTNDIGNADGLQIMYPGGDRTSVQPIPITLRFGKPVDLTGANLLISAFDEDGAFLDTIPVQPDADTADVAEFTLTQGSDLRDWTITIDDDLDASVRTIKIRVAEGVVSSDAFEDNATKKVDHTVTVLDSNPDRNPDVLKIALVGEPFSPITSATFQIHVLLSEEPKEALKDILDVSEATVDTVVKLASPTPGPPVFPIAAISRNGDDDETDPGEAEVTAATAHTWRDGKIHLYLVTLKTAKGEKTVKIKLKNWSSMEKPGVDSTTGAAQSQAMYIRYPIPDAQLAEGRDILMLKTKTDDPAAAKKDGIRLNLPKDKVIPAGGYLVYAEHSGESQIIVPGGDQDKTPKAADRTEAGLLYNVVSDNDNDKLPNLETFLANGGVIDVESPHALVITEIMWGSDASLETPSNNQWIELYNAGDEYKTVDDDGATDANEAVTLVFYGPNEHPQRRRLL